MRFISKICLVAVISTSLCNGSIAAEGGPLLISEVPANQVFTDNEIIAVKRQDISSLKSQPTNALVSDYLYFLSASEIKPEQAKQTDLELLRSAALYKPSAYQEHPEGPIAVPIFDVASLAKHKLLQIEVYAKRSEFLSLLQASPERFASLSTSNRVNLHAAKIVLQDTVSIAPAVIDILIDTYSSQDGQEGLVLLSVLVDTQKSYKAAEALFDSNLKSPHKHQLLRSLSRHFSDSQQKMLLEQLIKRRSELASQAIIEYSRLPLSMINSELFYTYLSDENLGASSAYALSRFINREGDYSKLINYLTSNRSSRHAVANGILALKFVNTTESRAYLKQFMESDAMLFEDMKAEVATWLN